MLKSVIPVLSTRARSAELALCLAGSLFGCTFYTNCPEQPQGTGATAAVGTGGTSGAGTGGTGGTGGGPSGIIGEPPPGEWQNVTSNLEGVPASCGSVTLVSPKPEKDFVLASVASNGIFASDDGGQSWLEIGAGEDSTPVMAAVTDIIYDPEDPETYWVAGPYGGGVFKTTDDGENFAEFTGVSHIDSVSIDFTDPDRRTLLTSGHEQGHALFRSSDGGENWETLEDTLPSGTNPCSFAFVLDADTYLLACSMWGGGTGGVYRTTDGAQSWTRVSENPVWQRSLLASDGTLYWAGDTTGGLYASENRGETWALVSGAVPLVSIPPGELPDGRLVSATADYVVVSSDRGATWRISSPELPFAPTGIAYSPFQKAFFIWYLDCDGAVPSDAVMRFDFDHEAE